MLSAMAAQYRSVTKVGRVASPLGRAVAVSNHATRSAIWVTLAAAATVVRREGGTVAGPSAGLGPVRPTAACARCGAALRHHTYVVGGRHPQSTGRVTTRLGGSARLSSYVAVGLSRSYSAFGSSGVARFPALELVWAVLRGWHQST